MPLIPLYAYPDLRQPLTHDAFAFAEEQAQRVVACELLTDLVERLRLQVRPLFEGRAGTHGVADQLHGAERVTWKPGPSVYQSVVGPVLAYGVADTSLGSLLPCFPLRDAATPSDAKVERRKMRPKLRHAVLERDGFRCRHCGVGADQAVLHVDHVHPVSKGGQTTMSNLQTLCRDCNLGKFTSIPL